MSERQRVSAKAAGFKGQKSALPLESYGIESAEEIQNFYLRDNCLNKVYGASTLADTIPGAVGGITSMNAVKDALVVQRGTSLVFNFIPAYQSNPATYPFPTTSATLTSSSRLFSSAWRDRAAFVNGQDAFFFRYSNVQSASVGIDSVDSMGLDPPANTLASANFTTGAGNVDVGSHYYYIALYDASTNTESPLAGALPSIDGLYELNANATLNPPAVCFFGIASSAKQVTIPGLHIQSVVQSSPQYATLGGLYFAKNIYVVIYRTKAGDSPAPGALYPTPYRVPNTANSSNQLTPYSWFSVVNNFVDNTADASLSAISPPTNNSPPPTPKRLLAALNNAKIAYGAFENWQLSDYSGFKHVRFFRDQLFGIGAKSYGFTVNTDVSYGSSFTQKITGLVTDFRDLLHGSEVYQPNYWPYRWEVGRGDGQDAIGLGVLGDVALLIFKTGSTYYLAGSSPDNYVLRIMDTLRGACNQGTIQETSVGVITLDRSGFVLWDKIGQGVDISRDIFDYVKRINFSAASTFYSCYDPKKWLYRCSVAIDGVQRPNITFILDLNTMQWSYEQGTEGLSRINFYIGQNNFSTNAGIAVDSGKLYDFVGSATNGRVYDYSSDANLTVNGAAITAVWKSGTINFGDDQHKKRMRWIYLRARANIAWTVNIEVIPDYDENSKYVLNNWNVVSSQSLWYSSGAAVDGSLLWDDGSGNVGGNWANVGAARYVSKIPVSCIGRSFQIRVTHNNTTDQDFAIESISAEAVMLGR